MKKKKLTKSQIDNKFRQAAVEYQEHINMYFDDLCFKLEMETGLDEDEVQIRLGELV